MAHTNSTTNYALPQFLPADKPAWLTDINGAFATIDTAVDAAKDAADNAQSDATQALTDAGNAATAAATADAKGSGAVASIEAAFDPTTVYSIGAKVMYNSLLYRCTVAVVTPGPWTGSANWERITVDSLIALNDQQLPHSAGGSAGSVSYAIDKLETGKQNKVLVATGSGTSSANGNITVSRGSKFVIIAAWCNVSTTIVLPWIDAATADSHGATAWTLHFMAGNNTQSVVPNTAFNYYYAYIEV